MLIYDHFGIRRSLLLKPISWLGLFLPLLTARRLYLLAMLNSIKKNIVLIFKINAKVT